MLSKLYAHETVLFIMKKFSITILLMALALAVQAKLIELLNV